MQSPPKGVCEGNLNLDYLSKEPSKEASLKRKKRICLKSLENHVPHRPLGCMIMPPVSDPWACSTAVLFCSMVVRSSVLVPLVLQGFIRPLFFLEITPKVLLSIKTRRFLLKVRQNML